MSAIKNPVLKKKKSLKKDHRVFVWEGNKTFRGLWRKKKRRLAKKERRAVGRVLGKVDLRAVDEAESPKGQIPKEIRKTGVVTLGRALEIREKDPRKRFSHFHYSSKEFEK